MKKRTFQSQLLTTAFQALLYLCVFAAFFLMQSIGNPQLLNFSRTAGVTMATFTSDDVPAGQRIRRLSNGRAQNAFGVLRHHDLRHPLPIS